MHGGGNGVGWRDALRALESHSHIEAFRQLCSDENGDVAAREAWRKKVVRMAAGEMGAVYPSIASQVGSVLGAAGRAIGGVLQGVEVVRSGEEQARCLAICQGCEHYVTAESRCRICGCFAMLKIRLATERCPLDPPKW
jgi:hypothetical protein